MSDDLFVRALVSVYTEHRSMYQAHDVTLDDYVDMYMHAPEDVIADFEQEEAQWLTSVGHE